ncbi:hypothetical protein QOZ80_2BG0193350 [Eleusine coracana subsp. coracana]|nr:hypothetical protein QOZ80_2BG0193350 [Eleusine coracana subsp. coracana]
MCGVLVVAAIIVLLETILVLDSRHPRYYAAITSASGLDSATNLTLHPDFCWIKIIIIINRPIPYNVNKFNLTLCVESRNLMKRACLKVGSALDVSYDGVRLAGTPAPYLCSGKGKSAQVGPGLAWGTTVHVLGSVLVSLAADMRAGTAAFDVIVTVQSLTAKDEYSEGRQRQLVRCLARRVGDEGVLRAPCHMHHVDAAVVASQQGT